MIKNYIHLAFKGEALTRQHLKQSLNGRKENLESLKKKILAQNSTGKKTFRDSKITTQLLE